MQDVLKRQAPLVSVGRKALAAGAALEPIEYSQTSRVLGWRDGIEAKLVQSICHLSHLVYADAQFEEGLKLREALVTSQGEFLGRAIGDRVLVDLYLGAG